MKFQPLKFFMVAAAAFGAGCAPQTASTPVQNNTAPAVNVPVDVAATPAATPPDAAPQLDVPYVPTPEIVVDEMLKMAQVKGDDVLYDLGSGDGRIPITAAQRFGTRGVGIDLNPVRVREANANAEKARVTDKVRFVEGDLFKEDFSEATVLTLYLLPEVNLKLKPKILAMKPGTRVVSHNYNMGDDWAPESWKEIKTPDGTAHYVYFWRVPEKQ